MSASTHERFVISGDVGAPGFPRWIERHAGRLGLRARIGLRTPGRIELSVGGPADLVDAMEIGCSLGPIDVWVETIRRESLPPETAPELSEAP